MIKILRSTKSIIPARRMSFKRTVTLSRVKPTSEAISRCGKLRSMRTPPVPGWAVAFGEFVEQFFEPRRDRVEREIGHSLLGTRLSLTDQTESVIIKRAALSHCLLKISHWNPQQPHLFKGDGAHPV